MNSENLNPCNGEPTKPLEKILFFVRDYATPCNSYTWRIWPGGTSFYIKSTVPGLTDMKLSLHGPRPENPGPGPWLKFGRDSSVAEDTGVAAGRWNLPIWFAGHEVRPNVRHCVRFRFDWTMFRPGVLSGPSPGVVKRPGRAQAGVVRHAPSIGFSLDVDLFVSDGEPCWPDEARARPAEALLGPLHNKAGQWLTGEVHLRRLSLTPTWEQVAAPTLVRNATVIRGLGFGVDKAQVLWVNEVPLNQTELMDIDLMDADDARAVTASVPAALQSPKVADAGSAAMTSMLGLAPLRTGYRRKARAGVPVHGSSQ